MRAIQLVRHGVPGVFQFSEVTDPTPGEGEVVVEVGACGLNHLDLWLEQGGLPMPVELPRIPGCEIAGTVRATGPGVTGWEPGRRVAVQSNLFCGLCEYCVAGQENVCLRGRLLGVNQDGGFAELVAVPAGALVALPSGLSFETSAAVSLAGSTAMHMLTRRAEVRPGAWVLVMGASSGVGSAGILIAKELGARVITTGSTPGKREFGLKLGAEAAVNARSQGWAAEVRKLTGRRGVDVIVEHIGGAVLEQAFDCLARGGTVVTCGATAGREVRLNLWPLFVKEHRLVGSYGRDRADLERTLDWVAKGRLRAVIGNVYELPETPGALVDLRAGRVMGKAVVRIRTPSGP